MRGSTLVARRAGTSDAINATSNKTKGTKMKVARSVGVTWNSKLDITRVIAYAPTNPTTVPTTTSDIAYLNTSFNTSPTCAPSAIRIPISRVRCVTAYAVTP